MKKNINYLQSLKNKQKIAMLTCYDYPTAKLEEEAGIDIVLIGDSVGTNILGYDSEKEVTIEDIIHHTKAVARGAKEAYIISDMPYLTYENKKDALCNAKKLISAGADGIKVEGYKPDIVEYLTSSGIDVCAHLGLNPQTDSVFRMKGKTPEEAKILKEQSLAIQKAGAKLLVLELMPKTLAGEITNTITIPTIGIGAGGNCDGQVQVVNDILGLTEKKYKHAKRYLKIREAQSEVYKKYINEVKNETF